MRKTVELLNEFSEDVCPWMFTYTDKWDYVDMSFVYWWSWKINDETICCKSYKFIEWLVKNHKIEWKNFWEVETISSKYSDYELSYDSTDEDYINVLLMELSLHDEPIKFLETILK